MIETCRMYYFINLLVRWCNKECGMTMKFGDDYLIDWLGRCVVSWYSIFMKKTSNVKTLVKKRSAIESGAKFSHSHSLVLSGSRCVVAYIKVKSGSAHRCKAVCFHVIVCFYSCIPMIAPIPGIGIIFRDLHGTHSLHSVYNSDIPFSSNLIQI